MGWIHHLKLLVVKPNLILLIDDSKYKNDSADHLLDYSPPLRLYSSIVLLEYLLGLTILFGLLLSS